MELKVTYYRVGELAKFMDLSKDLSSILSTHENELGMVAYACNFSFGDRANRSLGFIYPSLVGMF